ncbi:sugar O-acetyltransferase [Foetidibacter luteolus]|uniref:sugar O-acetyltransferase n=1 Tax=Foetidibacter luteolus TaxID=2608880 RepID=UPI00129AB49C|nr:sugar O-acetyltransferase [Foetidibacter luteolus]
MAGKTQLKRMLNGEMYNSSDELLAAMRANARRLAEELNSTLYDKEKRTAILQKLLGKCGENIDIQSPFLCDYGCHIEVGDNFYANFNCIFLDCNYIRIGNNVFIAPNVQIYAAQHPVIAAERIKGPEMSAPVTIGDNVWIGGGSIICPGVTIGSNTTIGAGSVVVKNIPANVVAAGNPCRVIRELQ